MHDLFERSPHNPVLAVDDLPLPAIGAYNPGVAEVGGEVLMLVRVEGVDGVSRLHVARSADGETNWRLETTPLLAPEDTDSPHTEFGCEDPRITYAPELGAWVIVYVAAGTAGPSIALAVTKDWKRVERLGVVVPPSNKNAALFPRRIGGEWVMLHRPESGTIWTLHSPDLHYWGKPALVMRQRGGTWWDSVRIGGGAVPIETPEGWLMIYHGVKEVARIPTYRLGVALLDLEQPHKVIARGRYPVFAPLEPYERQGNGYNIVFTCGAFVRGSGDDAEVWVYYGAADTVIGLAKAPLKDVLAATRNGDRYR